MKSVWSFEALKNYVDQRFTAAEIAIDKAVASTVLAVDKAFAQSQRAIDKAEEAVEKRLEGMNEFRQQLNEERANYLTLESWEQQKQALVSRIEVLEKWLFKILGALGLLSAVVPILVALATYFAIR